MKPDKVIDLIKEATAGASNTGLNEKEETEPDNNQSSIEFFEPPFGTMPPASPFYIERDADSICWNYILQGNATTIYIQAPRQMGKSSLTRHIAHRAETQASIKTVFIDFEKFTEAQMDHEEDFLIELCLMISDSLDIPEKIDQYWGNRKRSNIVKCSNYLAQYISASYDKSFILAMDEVERILTRPLCNDFFGMLRTWHNDRSWDANFRRITLLLSSSTEPDLFISNPNQSPFNVAEKVFMSDFSAAETAELNKRYQNALNAFQLEKLMNLLNGHPFLTRLALYLIAVRRTSFEDLLANPISESGPFGDHLRRYWQFIMGMPDIKQRLFEITHSQNSEEDKLFYRLKGAGLISKRGSKITMRNNLYQTYFRERLNG